MENTYQERRQYVNEEFAKQVEGQKYSNSQKAKILKRIWREAKRKYK